MGIEMLGSLFVAPTAGRGGLGGIISWFIRVVIYDIIVTTIAEVLGVPRLVALFIFLGILLAIGFIGYVMKQKMSPAAED
jgi:uncharacterized membrane protein